MQRCPFPFVIKPLPYNSSTIRIPKIFFCNLKVCIRIAFEQKQCQKHVNKREDIRPVIQSPHFPFAISLLRVRTWPIKI
jgi:hypothetical protein